MFCRLHVLHFVQHLLAHVQTCLCRDSAVMNAALLCKSTGLSRLSLDCDASSYTDKQNFSPTMIMIILKNLIWW